MPESPIIEGMVYPLGDYINCDSIIPVRFCTRPSVDVIKDNCLTTIDTGFPIVASKGVVIVAGRDFGRGSSNENSVRALQLCGVKAVVADSLARIFQRNAINLGFVAVECTHIRESVDESQSIKIDLQNWTVKLLTLKKSLRLRPVSVIEREILECGGLISYIKNKKMG